MATKKMSTIQFIRSLQSLDRGFFTVADLEKITGQSRSSLKVTLNRLVNKKILTRLKRGVYQLSLSSIDVKKIANQLYYPSYLSFESALSDYGILSQIPYTQTFATTKKSKKMVIGNTEAEFTQIKNDLFWGYKLKNDINIAEPEKALLDQLYLASRGKRTINLEELNLGNINKKLLKKFAKKFPSYLEDLLSKLNKYL